ncbi:G2-specific protein kinase nim-1 like [Verticillium longisporum]|nr:G2-specific protein kinase nim-1 like [Verticillium longisporum]
MTTEGDKYEVLEKIVFLGEDNSVKLGDFGLAKMIQSHDFASTYVGTPFYMSPEICAAEKYTLKSDIWSLGCIMYELCAREPPFNAKTHFQLVQKIKEGKVNPLPDIYSPELMGTIKDCLRVNPDRRPDTAQLLHLPIVRLMRKEKETVDFNKMLKAKEEALAQREKELQQKMERFEAEKDYTRQEIDNTLRREWEVKARLEIDRLVQLEMERLNKRFEDEVHSRVQEELRRKAPTFNLQAPMLHETSMSSSVSVDRTDYERSPQESETCV